MAAINDSVGLGLICANWNYLVISRLKTDYKYLSLTQLYYTSVIIAIYPKPFTHNFFCIHYASLTRWHDDKIHDILTSLTRCGVLTCELRGKRYYYGYTPLFERFRLDYIKQYEYLSNRRKHLLTDTKQVKKGWTWL